MGRPGPALDNAVIESWHSTVEFELRRIEHFATNAAARAKVAVWIEDYNTVRRHSALGMKSPVAYEQGHAVDAFGVDVHVGHLVGFPVRDDVAHLGGPVDPQHDLCSRRCRGRVCCRCR